jgi:GAF domain-containing protein
MRTWLKGLLAPPVFEGDEEKTRIAGMLNILAIAAGLLLLLAGALHIPNRIGEPDVLPNVVRMSITTLFMILTLVLIRRGQVRTAGLLFSLAIWISTLITSYTTGGMRSYEFPTFIVVVVAVGLVLGVRAAFVAVGATVLAGAGFILLEQAGLSFSFDPATYLSQQILVGRALDLLSVVIVLYLAMRGITSASARAQSLATELQDQRTRLEQIVAERTGDLVHRTRYLEATTSIARDAATILDLPELLTHVVTMIGEQLGFYHVGVFMLDSAGEWAVLQAASSDQGQLMLRQGHRLRVGEMGIVGYVTHWDEPRIADNVAEDPFFFSNPYLPATRSEVALPLRGRGRIIGALDVQSTDLNAFHEQDVANLQTLADQLAVAISNARLFEQVQASREAERRAYGELSLHAWRQLLVRQSDLGFHKTEQGVSPAGNYWRPEMDAALAAGKPVLAGDGTAAGSSSAAGSRPAAVAIPIMVGGQAIGVVHANRSEAPGSGSAADSRPAAWSSEDVSLLETLTAQLGQALESARLFQSARRQAAREQLVGEVTSRMRETLDMDAVLQTAVQEMRQALGLHDVTIRLEGPDGLDQPPYEKGGRP